jgi:aminopeptidase-like protein
MANHELSGPLVWSNLYNLLKKTGPHNLTYRFVVAPENIGAAAFLSKNLKSIKKDTKAGYIINCVGYGNEFTLKKSRQGNSISDRAARNILRFKKNFTEVDFFPDGSDERQFCSPGFNLPIALVMRKMFGTFREYHNSLDNEKLISFETIKQSIETYYDILMTIDNNFIPKAKILYGTPQLSKSKIDLYPKIMTFGTKPKSNRIKIMLEILNRADGSMDLIEIFEKNSLRLIDHIDLIKDLLKSGYIKKLN